MATNGSCLFDFNKSMSLIYEAIKKWADDPTNQTWDKNGNLRAVATSNMKALSRAIVQRLQRQINERFERLNAHAGSEKGNSAMVAALFAKELLEGKTFEMATNKVELLGDIGCRSKTTVFNNLNKLMVAFTDHAERTRSGVGLIVGKKCAQYYNVLQKSYRPSYYEDFVLVLDKRFFALKEAIVMPATYAGNCDSDVLNISVLENKVSKRVSSFILNKDEINKSDKYSVNAVENGFCLSLSPSGEKDENDNTDNGGLKSPFEAFSEENGKEAEWLKKLRGRFAPSEVSDVAPAPGDGEQEDYPTAAAAAYGKRVQKLNAYELRMAAISKHLDKGSDVDNAAYLITQMALAAIWGTLANEQVWSNAQKTSIMEAFKAFLLVEIERQTAENAENLEAWKLKNAYRQTNTNYVAWLERFENGLPDPLTVAKQVLETALAFYAANNTAKGYNVYNPMGTRKADGMSFLSLGNTRIGAFAWFVLSARKSVGILYRQKDKTVSGKLSDLQVWNKIHAAIEIATNSLLVAARANRPHAEIAHKLVQFKTRIMAQISDFKAQDRLSDEAALKLKQIFSVKTSFFYDLVK